MAEGVIVKYDGNFNQLLFADHATDFGAAPATAANSLIVGTNTDVQIDLTGLAASGGARESDKTADLGAQRPNLYRVDACLEFESAPTDSHRVEFFWAGSPSATAATGNAGGITGSDAAYTHAVGAVAQLQRIGSLYLRANVINIGVVGYFTPYHRYGTLLIVNQASVTLRSSATAMDETHVTMTAIARALYE